MVGLLLIPTGSVLARAVVLASSAVAPTNDDWFAQTALGVILAILLVGGVAILAIGLRHLVRDLWQWYPRSHRITFNVVSQSVSISLECATLQSEIRNHVETGSTV
jgi:hypothetical protein